MVVVVRQPPPSRISSEGGDRAVVERQPPPSRISSEGGDRAVVERQPPSSCVSSEGGSRVVVEIQPVRLVMYILCRVIRLNTVSRKKKRIVIGDGHESSSPVLIVVSPQPCAMSYVSSRISCAE